MAVLVAALSILGSGEAHALPPGDVSLVSRWTDGTQIVGVDRDPVISADGRFVAFTSGTQVLDGYPEPIREILLRDTALGVTIRVSVSDSGEPGNDHSGHPSISADGRYVAFESLADNLVADDRNRVSDVFVRDVVAGTTALASVTASGRRGNGASSAPEISNDGRIVVFHTRAFNLSPDYLAWSNVVARDMESGSIEDVSILPDGGHADPLWLFPRIAMSEDARFVVFEADGFGSGVPGCDEWIPWCGYQLFLRDRLLGTTVHVSRWPSGATTDDGVGSAAISPDGRYVLFRAQRDHVIPMTPWASALTQESFWLLFDGDTGTTSYFLVGSDGQPLNEFEDRDAQFGILGLLGGQGDLADFSADGSAVAFVSGSSRVVPGDSNRTTDAFVRDLFTGDTERISVSSGGREANAETRSVSVASGVGSIAFGSLATDLVVPDIDGQPDIFLMARGYVRCPSGAADDGPISGVVRDVIGGVPPLGRAASCAIAEGGL